MAKIDVTIPEDIKETLQELAEASGQSVSAVAADCIKLGLPGFLELRTKMEVFRKLRHQNRQLQANRNKEEE